MIQRSFWLIFLVVAVVAAAQAETGLLARYDAADASHFVLEGDRIVEWKDLSGAGHALVQTNANLRPSWSNGVVSATAGQRMVAGGVTGLVSQLTVYAVVKAPPSYSPIVAFRTDKITEFYAAGWTVGAKPTLYTKAGSRDANAEVEDEQ